jgi:hypothetical protein
MRIAIVLIAVGLLLMCSTPSRAQQVALPLQQDRPFDLTVLPADGEKSALPAPAGERSLLSAGAAARLNSNTAALLGGIAGAGVGYAVLYLHCRDRFCEMWPIIGIVGGAVVGSSIGRLLAEGPRLPQRR